MTCGHCEQAIQKAIARLDPSARVEINRSAGEVRVHSDVSREDLAHTIADEGYSVT
jgi:copper chaperone